MNPSPSPNARSFQARLGRWCFVACLTVPGSLWIDAPLASGQSTALPPPAFRPRTDPMAVQDTDALREQLKRAIDSRGQINPLSDYVKSRSDEVLPRSATREQAAEKPSAATKNVRDEEAERIPTLDRDSQKRLKSNPPSVNSADLGFVQVLPPPRLSPSGAVVLLDDGFRPVGIPSDVITATYGSLNSPTWVTDVSPAATSWRVVSNLPQIDPGASIPPSLGGIPPYSSVPSSVPSVSNPPASIPGASIPMAGAPVYGAPAAGTPYPGPVGLPPGVAPGTVIPGAPIPGGMIPGSMGPSSVAPASIVPGQMVPSSTMPGAIQPATAPSTASPVLTYPAPPSYVVPSPVAAAPGGVYPPGAVAGAGSPYASGPLPSYSRTSSWVNSAPFVSPPPASVDAKWMVSPAVYRQAIGADCPPTFPVGTTMPYAPSNPSAYPNPSGVGGTPMGPGGVYGTAPTGIVPSTGLTPTQTASPFAYAPMAAMPPQTVYVAGNGGYTPLVGFGQGANAQLGSGMWGQPTAYVDGQNFKNFLRYISP
jgi:hypothetical protein